MEDTPKKQCKGLKNMEFLKVALSVNLSEVAFQNQTGVQCQHNEFYIEVNESSTSFSFKGFVPVL